MAKILEVPKKVIDGAADVVKDVAESAKEKAGKGADAVADKAAETKDDIENALYKPIFSLEEIEAEMPRIIHVADNPKLKQSKVCKGAIGYREKMKGLKMMGLLPENVEMKGIKFYPNTSGILYYRDPYNAHVYIDLDDYFDYLNEVRVNEIKDVAHALGAKHVKVVYKEEKKSLIDRTVKAKAAAKNKGRIKVNPEGEGEFEHKKSENEYSNIEVLADAHYDESDEPTVPTLIYLKNDPAIKSLIERRMDGDRSLKKETYSIKCKSLQGIKQEDVAKLDGVLKQLKIGGNASVSSESEAEQRAVLEYTIEF